MRFCRNETLLKHYLNNLKRESLELKETETDKRLREIFEGSNNYFGLLDWAMNFPAYLLPKKTPELNFDFLVEVLNREAIFTEGKVRDNYFLVYIPDYLANKPISFKNVLDIFKNGSNGFIKIAPELFPDHEDHRSRYGDLLTTKNSGWFLVSLHTPKKMSGRKYGQQLDEIQKNKHFNIGVHEAFMASQLYYLKHHKVIDFGGFCSDTIDEINGRHFFLRTISEEKTLFVSSPKNDNIPKDAGIWSALKFPKATL